MSKGPVEVFDRELLDLPAEMRWREWMMRVEALIFASQKPVPRAALASLIGAGVVVDTVIEAIQIELRTRPYELVQVAGGWQHRTRERYGPMLRSALASPAGPVAELTRRELELLAVVAFRQPVTRRQCEEILGRAVSGDDIGRLRALGLIAPGHRKPGPGAPYTLVTTDRFLEQFQLGSLSDLGALDTANPALG
jgi:segregation and condensation protein B